MYKQTGEIDISEKYTLKNNFSGLKLLRYQGIFRNANDEVFISVLALSVNDIFCILQWSMKHHIKCLTYPPNSVCAISKKNIWRSILFTPCFKVNIASKVIFINSNCKKMKIYDSYKKIQNSWDASFDKILQL